MLIVWLALAIGCIQATAFGASAQENLIETITSANGRQVVELAFRAPAKGVPRHVLEMFCANVKLRLYWGVYRETIKGTARTGQDVRRLARLARHYYPEIRAVDNPFDAHRLTRDDDWFSVKDSPDNDKAEAATTTDDHYGSTPKRELGQSRSKYKTEIKQTLSERQHNDDVLAVNKEIKQQMDSSLGVKSEDDDDDDEAELSEETNSATRKTKKTRLNKIANYVKRYAPKVGIGIYTRWTTMWWLMMSCLFTKYYLWDPALDDFIKLKKTMIMYPDFLTLKLQDIDCLPTKFFQKIISACIILNPLLNYSFGQLSLDNMMRFKSRAS